MGHNMGNITRNFSEEAERADVVEVETLTRYFNTDEFSIENNEFFWVYDEDEGELTIPLDENTSITPQGTSGWELKRGEVTTTVYFTKVLGIND